MRTSSCLSLPFFILAVATFVGCSNDSPTTPSYGSSNTSSSGGSSQTNTVSITNFAFSPASMTVPKNTTVTWQNNGASIHTSTSDTGAWDTGDLPAGGTKTATFASTGTFPYHCAHHPSMTGTIIVQ